MVVPDSPPKTVMFENTLGMEKTMRKSINEGILEDLDEEESQVKYSSFFLKLKFHCSKKHHRFKGHP